MSGGKGGSSNTSGYNWSTGTSSTQIPSWLESAAQGAVAQGQAIAATPYQAYTGQLVAGTPADTQQAYAQIQQMQGMGMPQYAQDINAYGGLLSQVNPLTAGQINQLSTQLYGNYAGNVVAPSAGLLGGYMQGGPTTAGQIGAGAQTLMSPYAQSVIAPTMQLGQQALAQNLQQIGAGANQAGAFGGTRQGVQEGVAQAQTALGESNLLGTLLNTGWNQALGSATQAGLQAGQQGYGAAGTLSGLLASGYGAAQQAGQGLAGTNLQAGLTAAQQLPGALTAQQTAAAQQAQALLGSGALQQQQAQNLLNAQYGQWEQQIAWPYMQQQELLSTLSGVPYGTTTSGTQYGYGSSQATQTPSWGSQISQGAGLLGTVLGFL